MKLLFSLLLAISLFTNPLSIYVSDTFLLETVNHCGSITTNETWSSNSVHFVSCTVIVGTNVTLTITEGTVVKFDYGDELVIDGTLRALGTPANPIYFTSYRDDSIGGDTNGDGSASTPASGNWQKILFRDASNDANSIIQHARIRYGGAFGYGSVSLVNASPTLQNNVFEFNQNAAIEADVNAMPLVEGNTFQSNRWNGILLTDGTVTGNKTWGITNAPYIIDGKVFVGVGATLIIAPGVIIKSAYGSSLTIDGALKALGTVDKPIYFTSYRDDGIGGDTNGDGSETVPVPGNWSALHFRDNTIDGETIINYAVIRYGGQFVSGNILLENASPRIQNSVLAYSSSAAIQADLNASPIILNNTYHDNSWNGIRLTNGTVTGNKIWNILDAPYVIDGDIFVGVGSNLTIAPGVIIKFDYAASLVVDGSLRAVGTPAKPIYFTSYRDDGIGGDTNGDGSTNLPNRGNWSGLEFRDTSNDATTFLEHTVIRYAGQFVSGSLLFNRASPNIRYTSISESSSAGIHTNTAAPILVCNKIYDNDIGLRNETTATVVNAASQWWGDVTGPYHAMTNPSGKGNSVSDGVTYKPWRTAPCTIVPNLSKHFYLPLTRRDTP